MNRNAGTCEKSVGWTNTLYQAALSTQTGEEVCSRFSRKANKIVYAGCFEVGRLRKIYRRVKYSYQAASNAQSGGGVWSRSWKANKIVYAGCFEVGEFAKNLSTGQYSVTGCFGLGSLLQNLLALGQ